MKKTQSIRTFAWWLLDHLQLTNCSAVLAQKVLVPNVQAAEDLNLWPFTAASTAFWARPLQHAPHQPSNLMLIKLIVPSIGGWQLKAMRKPVAAKVLQVAGQFPPKVFENQVLLNVL